jgi:hypothetical protein
MIQFGALSQVSLFVFCISDGSHNCGSHNSRRLYSYQPCVNLSLVSLMFKKKSSLYHCNRHNLHSPRFVTKLFVNILLKFLEFKDIFMYVTPPPLLLLLSPFLSSFIFSLKFYVQNTELCMKHFVFRRLFK